MTVGQAIKLGQDKIGRRDAMLLLSNATGLASSHMMLNLDSPLSSGQSEIYNGFLQRRQCGEPTQHILGKWDFMGHEFITDSRALIPRPETELLVQQVLEFIGGKSCQVLDLCTGSGCIGISIALASAADVTAADISPAAISLAMENAAKLNANINIIQSDLFSQVSGRYHAIVSNPPYITRHEMKELDHAVLGYEPHLALDGGEDGLDFYKKIIPQSKHHLHPGGMLFLEIGTVTDVAELMEAEGFGGVKLLYDYAGLPRIVYGVNKNV
ncbi:MAG: peptide chain release factor N(5)-glutamine methyltransferase [Defluviitaleaceae bacterium]|nr:peptide chain release factor N(5)-glutamine methyltransferase [Defluviitaleaceae bacterium]